MSTPPPRRRRISSVVTVRRAQSERRYLSPWQVAHAAAATHSRFWQPTVLYHPAQAVPPPGCPPPLLPPPPKSGWTRMERIVDHRIDHHHHAPRTALIPPPVPRHHHQAHMIGRSQLVLSGDLWGSVRQQQQRSRAPPFMSPAQLPPLALGSPPPVMAVPPLILPPGNLQEKLSQDRLSAFFSGETASYKPRSILSCPESPLYESLVSTFSTLEDEINFQDTDTEHEYQQIPALTTLGKKPQTKSEPAKESSSSTPSSSRNQTEGHELESEYQTVNDARITTLDVRPEKNAGREKDLELTPETQVCNCQSNKSSDPGSGVASPVSRKVDSSSQTVTPSSEFHRSSVYISDDRGTSPMETQSTLSDSDTYQDIDRPPTVIYLPNTSKELAGRSNQPSKNDENGKSSPETKASNPGYSGQDKRAVLSPRPQKNAFSTPSSANSNYAAIKTITTNNNKNSNSNNNNNHVDPSRAQKKSVSKTPETPYLPLTIELPETKENPRKPDHQSSKRNQDLTTSQPPPHIITTLDPPIRNNKNFPDWSSESNDIPPLVVNFDSESEDDLALEADLSSSTTLDDNSTSIYVTGDDTTSLYSSIAELYSVIPGDPDSLVYVYRAVPNTSRNDIRILRQSSSVGYRIPSFILNRSDDCSSCSSCGSEGSWSDTISFVEPTYRPTNLSVGSRGHLKIDYSWSWDSLDDFVRTTSPREGSAEEMLSSPRRSVYSSQSPQGKLVEERKVSRGPHPQPGLSPPAITSLGVALSPWEKYSDPVAG